MREQVIGGVWLKDRDTFDGKYTLLDFVKNKRQLAPNF